MTVVITYLDNIATRTYPPQIEDDRNNLTNFIQAAENVQMSVRLFNARHPEARERVVKVETRMGQTTESVNVPWVQLPRL